MVDAQKECIVSGDEYVVLQAFLAELVYIWGDLRCVPWMEA